MFSRGIKVLIAVVVIGLLLSAGTAVAKPGHGHGYNRGHLATLSHGKGNNNHGKNNIPGTPDKKGRIRISLITGSVSIESSTTVSPSHVHLRLLNPSGKAVRAAQSKKNGAYKFKNLKLVPGDYTVKAWIRKMRVLYSGETTLRVEAGKSTYTGVDITLK